MTSESAVERKATAILYRKELEELFDRILISNERKLEIRVFICISL